MGLQVTHDELLAERAAAVALRGAGAQLRLLWGGSLLAAEDLPYDLPRDLPHEVRCDSATSSPIPPAGVILHRLSQPRIAQSARGLRCYSSVQHRLGRTTLSGEGIFFFFFQKCVPVPPAPV